MVDNIRNCFLLDKAALIDRIFGQIWLNDIQPAKMAAAVAIITDAVLLVVMAKVG
jgi:hypothetical protein